MPARNPDWGNDDPTGVYPAAVADPEVFKSLSRLRPEDHNLWIARVRHLARQCEWRQAAAVATQLNALDRANVYSWLHEAALLYWVGDREGYHRVCRRILERYGTSTDLAAVRRLVVSCLLDPDGVADLGALAPLVDRLGGTARSNKNAYSILGAAFYEYRLGRYRAAIDRLQPLPEAVTTNAVDQAIQAMACVIRAMANQKLDQSDEARRQLAAADATAKPVNFDPRRAGPLPPRYYNEWFRYHILRREAEGLFRGAAAPGEPKRQ